MSEENIETITKLDSSIAPTFGDHHLFSGINFNWHCLIKNDISTSKIVINLYIVYTLGPQLKKFKHRFYIK